MTVKDRHNVLNTWVSKTQEVLQKLQEDSTWKMKEVAVLEGKWECGFEYIGH